MKNIGKKVGFAAVFTHYQKRALPKEALIHTVKITAIKIVLKEIQKREYKRWVIYTESQSSIQFDEYNKEKHLILIQIYNILTDL